MGCVHPKEQTNTARLVKDILGSLRIVIILVEIYLMIRRKWLNHLLKKHNTEKRPR